MVLINTFYIFPLTLSLFFLASVGLHGCLGSRVIFSVFLKSIAK